MNIGIEQNTKLIYESTGTYGHPIWPSPVMLQVIITSAEEKTFNAAKCNDLAPESFIFREDTYNSSSRVRRGRLYKAGNSQPHEWYLAPHPALGEQKHAERNGGLLNKRVFAFASFTVSFLNFVLTDKTTSFKLFIKGSCTIVLVNFLPFFSTVTFSSLFSPNNFTNFANSILKVS